MAFAFVQSKRTPISLSSSGDGTFTATTNGNVAAGNLLVAGIAWDDGQHVLNSLGDARGTTWAAAATRANTGAGMCCQIWYGIPTTTGALTVTGTMDAPFNGSVTVVVGEYSGNAAADVLDDAKAHLISSTQNPSDTLTAAAADELLVGWMLNTVELATEGSGLTARESGALAYYDIYEDKLSSASGSNTVGFTTTQAVSAAYAAACFKSGTSSVAYVLGSDISVGGYTDNADGTTNLYTKLDEASPDSADYIKSALNPSADTYEGEFYNVQAPAANNGGTLSYQAWGDGDCPAVAVLIGGDGATTIKSWTHTALPGTPTRYDRTIGTATAVTWAGIGYVGSRFRFIAG